MYENKDRRSVSRLTLSRPLSRDKTLTSRQPHSPRSRRPDWESMNGERKRKRSDSQTSYEALINRIVGNFKLPSLPDPVELVEKTSNVACTETVLDTSPLIEVSKERNKQGTLESSPRNQAEGCRPPEPSTPLKGVLKRNKLSLNRHGKHEDNVTVYRQTTALDCLLIYKNRELPKVKLPSVKTQALGSRDEDLLSGRHLEAKKLDKSRSEKFYEYRCRKLEQMVQNLEKKLEMAERRNQSHPSEVESVGLLSTKPSKVVKNIYAKEKKPLVNPRSFWDDESELNLEKEPQIRISKSSAPSTSREEFDSILNEKEVQTNELDSLLKENRSNPKEITLSLKEKITPFGELGSLLKENKVPPEEPHSTSEMNQDQSFYNETEENNCPPFENDREDTKILKLEYSALREEFEQMRARFIDKEKEWKTFSGVLKGQIKELISCCEEKDDEIAKLQDDYSVLKKETCFDHKIIAKLEKKNKIMGKRLSASR